MDLDDAGIAGVRDVVADNTIDENKDPSPAVVL